MTRVASYLLSAVLALGLALGSPSPSHAQLRQDSVQALQVGVLLQTVLHASGDPRAEAEGFLVDRARLSVEGQPAPKVSYELEVGLADGFELKDARIDYHFLPQLALRAGQFKTPFSYSFLTSSSRTPFVRRPRAVDALRLGRQVGAVVRYQPRSGPVTLRGGVFNGAAAEDPAVDDDLLLYVGRATWQAVREGNRLHLGINVGYDASAANSALHYGADVHLKAGRAFVTAEALARAETHPGAVSAGAYLMAGYALHDVHLVRARLDYIHFEGAVPDDESRAAPYGLSEPTLLGIGYTFLPDRPWRLEADYLVPLTAPGIEHSSVLINLQVNL